MPDQNLTLLEQANISARRQALEAALDTAPQASLEAEVTPTDAEARISTTVKGGTLTAYGRYAWAGFYGCCDWYGCRHCLSSSKSRIGTFDCRPRLYH